MTDLGVIGDLHKGTGGITTERADTAIASLTLPKLPKDLVYLQVGDLTENSGTSEDVEALTWLDQLPGRVYVAVGNHDIYTRTGDQAAAAWGQAGKNQSIDLGDVQLIILGPDASAPNTTTIVLSQDTIDYLDAQLTAVAPKPCLICCHAPLYNTVGVGQAGEFSSASAGFFVVGVDYANQSNGVRDQPIRDILAAHDNAKAWISGHTHNPPTTPALLQGLVLGTHTVACINASALVYTGTSAEDSDPLVALLLTADEQQIAVRYLDLKTALWTDPHGSLVDIVDLRKALKLVRASAQYVDLGTFDFAFPNPNQFTIEFDYFKATSGSRHSILNASVGGQIGLEYGGSAGGLVATIPGAFLAETGALSDEIGVRYHGAYVRWGTGATQQAWYRDGVKLSLATANAGTVTNASALRYIGRRVGSTAQDWDGGLANLRVWNHPRTGGQIRANMQRILSGDEPGLLSQWRLDDGAGTTAVDTGPGGHDGTLINGASWAGMA